MGVGVATGVGVGVGVGDGVGLGVGVGDGVGVGVGSGLPVTASTIVSFSQRYSRIVSPEACTLAAISRPRYR